MNRNLRPVDDLAAFGISAECGFLPSPDPLARLPDGFEPWEEIAATLPKLLVADQHRAALDELPSLEIRGLSSAAEVERAMEAHPRIARAAATVPVRAIHLRFIKQWERARISCRRFKD